MQKRTKAILRLVFDTRAHSLKIQVLSKKGNWIGQYFKLYKRKAVDNLCGLHCFVLPKHDKARL